MSFSPYSQVVRPAEYIQPINLDLYAKGEAYKQSVAENNLKQLANIHDQILSIPAYGVDKQRLMEIDNEMKQKVQSLNVANLNDINTFSKIRGVMGEYTSNPDVLAIARRGTVYSQELEKAKKAEEAGKQYLSPILKQGDRYYNGNEFKTDVSFSGTGFDAKNIEQEYLKGLKDIPKVKSFKTEGGYRNTFEQYDPEALSLYTSSFYDDPTVRRQLEYQFDENYDGTDWQTQGQQVISTLTNQALANIQANQVLLSQLPKNDPRAQEAALQIAKYQQDIAQYQDMITKDHAPFVKQQLFNKHLEDMKKESADKMQFWSQIESKADEYALDDHRTANDLRVKAVENASKLESQVSGLSSLQQAYVRKLIASGVPKEQIFTTDPTTGKTVIDFETLPDIPEKKLAQKEAAKESGVRKINNLVSDLKSGYITPTTKEALDGIVKKHKKELGLEGDEIQSATLDNDGNIVIKRAGITKKDITMTPEEFEAKLSGVKEEKIQQPTGATGATGSTGVSGSVNYGDSR